MLKRTYSATVAIAALGLGVLLWPAASVAEEASGTAALMNAKCPFTGKPATAERFVDYADKDGGVYARISFCCGNCQGNAAKMDAAALKPVYEKAFLTAEDGTKTEYGKAVLDVQNDKCPATGNAADGSTKMIYNGASLNLCCPGCDDQIAKDPDKFLPSINEAIQAAKAKAAS